MRHNYFLISRLKVRYQLLLSFKPEGLCTITLPLALPILLWGFSLWDRIISPAHCSPAHWLYDHGIWVFIINILPPSLAPFVLPSLRWSLPPPLSSSMCVSPSVFVSLSVSKHTQTHKCCLCILSHTLKMHAYVSPLYFSLVLVFCIVVPNTIYL